MLLQDCIYVIEKQKVSEEEIEFVNSMGNIT